MAKKKSVDRGTVAHDKYRCAMKNCRASWCGGCGSSVNEIKCPFCGSGKVAPETTEERGAQAARDVKATESQDYRGGGPRRPEPGPPEPESPPDSDFDGEVPF
ncbi:hypothetical protein LCGC14_0427810 [marine sediment metagenome]|uniref:Uncharacterized protein n=1 Tax=marine sediment metagenome TaxID=412755 RepID=A0A0F9VB75_9ZZZZ